MPRAAAVVLNYGTFDATMRCVEKLLECRLLELVVVVDNASPDGSGERLRVELPAGAVLVQSPDNRGYGPGNNLGLQHARRAGVETALVVNPDVLIEPADVERMLVRLVSPVAVVGNVLWNDEARTQMECFGAASYSPVTSRSRSALTVEQARRADFFSGACFVVDLAILERVGWLAEQYFLYYEELDLVRRLGAIGYTWTVAEDSAALHRRGESVGSSGDVASQSLLSSFYGTRSAIVFTRTWEPRYVVTVTMARLLRALRLALTSPRHARAVVSGVRSAWRSRDDPPGLDGAPGQAHGVARTQA